MRPRAVLLFSPDLLPYERKFLNLVIDLLSLDVDFQCIELTQQYRGYFKKHRVDQPHLIFAKNWKGSARFLSSTHAKVPVFFSIMGSVEIRKSLFSLFFRSLGKHPRTIKLISHSLFNHRYYEEIRKVPRTSLHFLHFPFEVAKNTSQLQLKKNDGFRVGTLCPITLENNVHFIANIAHFILNQRQNCTFTVFGTGPLVYHFKKMCIELKIQERVRVLEKYELNAIEDLDLFVYLPLRNDHFLPLWLAASFKIPVISSNIPGVDELIQDGQDGFVIPMYETVQMGEALLKLMDSQELRTNFGNRLAMKLASKFSKESLRFSYFETLFGRSELKLKVA